MPNNGNLKQNLNSIFQFRGRNVLSPVQVKHFRTGSACSPNRCCLTFKRDRCSPLELTLQCQRPQALLQLFPFAIFFFLLLLLIFKMKFNSNKQLSCSSTEKALIYLFSSMYKKPNNSMVKT